MKRLVVCTDGTWNAPEISRPEKNRPTNVLLKLCRAIAPTATGGTPQIVHYVPGVGTNGRIDRWLGSRTAKQYSYRPFPDRSRGFAGIRLGPAVRAWKGERS
jgi:uncharacterized protein (DUF2235 family)